MIKRHLIDGSTRDTGALLGHDVGRAFENVFQEYILDFVADIELGLRLYDYARSFLTGRKAAWISHFVSDEVLLGPLQGSAI